MIWSIFPKFYRQLDPHALAGLVRELDLDTTNLVVRDGYWVTRADFAKQAPAFVKAMAREGIVVHFATTDFTADELVKDPTPLKIFHEHGVRDVRIEWFHMPRGGNVEAALKSARSSMEKLAETCRPIGIRAILQLHHGMLITSVTAAQALVAGLPSENVGIEPDPGNQSREGFEEYGKVYPLLGKHLSAISIKDTVWHQDVSKIEQPGKGWSQEWAPIYEGVIRWDHVVAALAAAKFDQTIVMMSHFDPDEPDKQRVKVKREVEYLKKLIADSYARKSTK
jgi:sugar phosphate isomerase/epimerase